MLLSKSGFPSCMRSRTTGSRLSTLVTTGFALVAAPAGISRGLVDVGAGAAAAGIDNQPSSAAAPSTKTSRANVVAAVKLLKELAMALSDEHRSLKEWAEAACKEEIPDEQYLLWRSNIESLMHLYLNLIPAVGCKNKEAIKMLETLSEEWRKASPDGGESPWGRKAYLSDIDFLTTWENFLAWFKFGAESTPSPQKVKEIFNSSFNVKQELLDRTLASAHKLYNHWPAGNFIGGEIRLSVDRAMGALAFSGAERPANKQKPQAAVKVQGRALLQLKLDYHFILFGLLPCYDMLCLYGISRDSAFQSPSFWSDAARLLKDLDELCRVIKLDAEGEKEKLDEVVKKCETKARTSTKSRAAAPKPQNA